MKQRSLLKSRIKPPISSTWPEWVVKACWDSTAVLLLINARTVEEALDRAWKRISRTEGGDSCQKVIVVGQKERR